MSNRDSNRLAKVWDILAECAKNGDTMHYREVSARVSSTGNWGQFINEDLGAIGEKCNELNIPHLNSLVVNQEGKCGDGIDGGVYTPKCHPHMEAGIIFTYPGIFRENPFLQEQRQ
jgi:hypothetical protein